MDVRKCSAVPPSKMNHQVVPVLDDDFPHCVSLGDVNTGGIVAGVIVALLLLALLGFGIWYANKKGYLPSEFSLFA